VRLDLDPSFLFVDGHYLSGRGRIESKAAAQINAEYADLNGRLDLTDGPANGAVILSTHFFYPTGSLKPGTQPFIWFRTIIWLSLTSLCRDIDGNFL